MPEEVPNKDDCEVIIGGAEVVDRTNVPETIAVETQADVLVSTTLDSLTQVVESYLEVLAVANFVNDLDLRQLILLSLQELHVVPTADNIPIYKRDLFIKVLEKTMQKCITKMIVACQQGNLFQGLQYLMLAYEASRIVGLEVPPEIQEYYLQIADRVMPGGEFEALFKKVSILLPLRSPSRRYDTPAPSSYADFIKSGKNLQEVKTPVLVRYAAQSKSRNDWNNFIVFQRELIRREPNNTRYLIFLAYGLEERNDPDDLRDALHVRRKICSLSKGAELIKERRFLVRTERRLGGGYHANDRISVADAQGSGVIVSDAGSQPAPVSTAEGGKNRKDPVAAGPPPIEEGGSGSVLSLADETGGSQAPDEKPSNIDCSRFDSFLTSLKREALKWQAKEQDVVFLIPEVDKDILMRAIGDFEKKLSFSIPKKSHRAFWKSFSALMQNIHHGEINIRILGNLESRIPDGTDFSK